MVLAIYATFGLIHRTNFCNFAIQKEIGQLLKAIQNGYFEVPITNLINGYPFGHVDYIN